jgi:hypothetical protein
MKLTSGRVAAQEVGRRVRQEVGQPGVLSGRGRCRSWQGETASASIFLITLL